MLLSKSETHLPISPTSLDELGRSHIKKFHINICFIQHRGESSPHQPVYHDFTSLFHIIIEPDANHEYCEVNFSIICFLNNVIFSGQGLATENNKEFLGAKKAAEYDVMSGGFFWLATANPNPSEIMKYFVTPTPLPLSLLSCA
jgi:hypothetical protein